MLFVFLFIFASSAFSQDKEIAKLESQLAKMSNSNDSNKVNLLNDLAYKFCFVDLKKLNSYSNAALQLSRRINYVNGTAGAYKNLGLYYMLKDANPLALDYFDKSYKLYLSVNNRAGAVRALNNSGYFYSLIKDYPEGIRYYRLAEKQAGSLHEPRLKAIWVGNIGNNYEALGQLDSAYVYYKQMLALTLSKENRDLQGNAYSNLASYQLKKGKYGLAIQISEKMLALHKTYGFTNQEIADVYSILGKAYFKLNNFSKAEYWFNKTDEMARRAEYAEILIDNYHNFYTLDSIRGNYKSALRNLSLYSTMRDSLTNASKNKRIAFYQIKFQTEKNIAENQLLRKEEEKNKAYISQQQTKLIILIVVVVIIVIAGIILFRVNRRIQNKNKIINSQNQNLEELNLVKNKLFSVIAHDLRSPFSQIIPLMEMLEQEHITQEEFKEMAPQVKNHFVDSMLMLDNLLLWAKSQLNGFKLNPTSFALIKLSREVKSFFRESLEKKNISIENHINPNLLVIADEEMVKSVLRNLISNAIKFSQPGGVIRINSFLQDGVAGISVTDSGVGIAEQDLPKLFSFTNYTTYGTSQEKGTGLGLKICKDFVEANQGTISVQSEINKGTCFSFTLPLAPQSESQQAVMEEIVYS